MLIYKATNKINGKFYIGKTVNTLDIRKGHHIAKSKRETGQAFHRALKKYGPDNFKWEVLTKCKNENTLSKKELYWLRKYYGKNYEKLGCIGYNMVALSGGGDTFSTHPNKEKIRAKQIGKNNSFYGKNHTKEAINKISKYLSENRKGANHPLFGKKFKKPKESIKKENRHPLWLEIDAPYVINMYFNKITPTKIAKIIGVGDRVICTRFRMIGLYMIKNNSIKELNKRNDFIRKNKKNKNEFIKKANVSWAKL
jgi:group I intron endonuclease